MDEFTRTRSYYLELGDVVHNRLDEMVKVLNRFVSQLMGRFPDLDGHIN